ncbi:MAG: hypothetical protein H6545_01480 [Bacteroidales bacterium]|jgi:hypothetical protein|nr:hypothetical protein [Bacteroidales bacterium]MCB9027778.1 hypothetical protein [Bacteroidales bacterium]NLD63713.1 hypothetical protein [Bacteroidales bacterium]HOO67536.1 hypothetical protein [Bacteroidales bacterium]HPE22659.1 hypothetical protein [Bacteroidales bacterium]
MKRKILLMSAIVLMLPLWVAGQNMDDALRYSRLFYQGTARFNGMSGAFTALGGDISAISLNPAAAGVFRSTEVTITPLVFFRDMSTDFNGFGSDDSYSGLNLGQAGVVSSIKTGSRSGLTNLSFAYSFNRTNNYFRNAVIDGISNNGSMADFWALQATGYRTGELGGTAWMAYDTYLIDTLPNYLDEYASIFSYYGETDPQYGQQMKRTIDNAGYSNEHSLVLGANLGDKVYIGAGFGITGISYTGHYDHREMDEAQRTFDFVNFTFTDHFEAVGSGWNFKLGAIVRPFESLRLGLGFTTPTIYKIDEIFYNSLSVKLDNDTPSDPSDDANPTIDQGDMTYSYRVTTPYHLNAGIAYQVGNFALISADYEMVDYGSAKLSKGADGYDFAQENEDLAAELERSNILRLGAEVRTGPLYLRGGYGYHGSSFADGTLNEEASSNSYSAGLGYRQSRFYIDVAMVWLSSSEQYMMFPDDPRSFREYTSDPVNLNTKDKYLSVTVGLKF